MNKRAERLETTEWKERASREETPEVDERARLPETTTRPERAKDVKTTRNRERRSKPTHRIELSEAVHWLVSEDTGTSSIAILMAALGIPNKTRWGASPPSDEADRGRCRRLLRRLPWTMRGLDALAQADAWWGRERVLILRRRTR